MLLKLLSILISILLCVACSRDKTNLFLTSRDSAGAAVKVETVLIDDEGIDWTPDEFRKCHHDEWIVVKQAIDIQEQRGDMKFTKIDRLVRGYISLKGITLPSNKCDQIKMIEDLCKSKFDISGYDESNMGLHVADGTRRLFAMYVNWLYKQEAEKMQRKTKLVEIEKELELYNDLNNAFYDVCDSVAYCLSGTGYWVALAQIQDYSISFSKCMFESILGLVPQTQKELDVPFEMFDQECKALVSNYEPHEEGQAKDASHIVNRYKRAFHSWCSFRKSVASKIKNQQFKKSYESITYSFARVYFLHLKNRFSDIGLLNDNLGKVCLDFDCSNKELLEFNYEKKHKELLGI